MCQGICCEIGRHGDEIKVWFGDPTETGIELDSHAAIRKFHGLPEISRTGWRRTPLEHYFHDTPESAEKMERHFDEGRPEWWDGDCDAAVNAALDVELHRRSAMPAFPGYPKFIGKNVVIPWTACGGSIDASAATSLSLPKLETCSGSIDARAATSLSLPNLKSSGYIYASAATEYDCPIKRK